MSPLRTLLLRPRLCSAILSSGILLAAGLQSASEIHAKKPSFAQIKIEGKVLRQRPKGKLCKIEIDVSRASIEQDELRPVRARLVLLQPCVKGLKIGTRAFGVLNHSKMRANSRTTSDGTAIIEFSARVHGRIVGAVDKSTTGNLVAETASTASGRLIGDADVPTSK